MITRRQDRSSHRAERFPHVPTGGPAGAPGGEPANVCAPDLPHRDDVSEQVLRLQAGVQAHPGAGPHCGRRAGGKCGRRPNRLTGRETCQCVRAGSAVLGARRMHSRQGFRVGHAARAGGAVRA